MLYYLSKGHEELYGTKEALPYMHHKLFLGDYLVTTKTNYQYCRNGYQELREIDVEFTTKHRNEILGNYIEYILPTSIINNVLTPRPLLETLRIKRLTESVSKYGIISPPLVHVMPLHHNKFDPALFLLED